MRGTKNWFSLLLLFDHYNINGLSAFSYLSTTHLSDEPFIVAMSRERLTRNQHCSDFVELTLIILYNLPFFSQIMAFYFLFITNRQIDHYQFHYYFKIHPETKEGWIQVTVFVQI